MRGVGYRIKPQVQICDRRLSATSRLAVAAMAGASVVRVMLSSRVTDPIELGGRVATLSDVRRAIKAAIEAERLFGEQPFELWINEDAPAAEGSADSWETQLLLLRTG